MPQTAYPFDDAFNNGFTAVPSGPGGETNPISHRLNPTLNLNSVGEVTTTAGSSLSSFRVQLQQLVWPTSGPAAQIFMRWQKTGADPVTLLVSLLQGSDLVAFRTHTAPDASGNLDPPFVLSTSEQALISDYSQLYLQVITIGNVQSTCCTNPMPGILTLSFSGASPTCSLLNNLSLPLIYNATVGAWQATLSTNGGSSTVTFTCVPGGWNFNIASGGAGCSGVFPPGQGLIGTCGVETTMLSGTIDVGHCCSGTVNVTITG